MMDELEGRKKAVLDKVKKLLFEDSEQKAKPEQVSPAPEANKRVSEFLQKIASGNANWMFWLGLIPVLLISLYVRTRNLSLLAGKYLIELDSYFFFRYAKTIYETGTLPAIDVLRYSPLGYPTASFKFFPQTMVYLYKFVHVFFSNLTQIEWHIIYPPVITAISLVFFFLLVKELFNGKVALIASAFLAVIPAYIQRTSAGFADHEAMAMLWIFISLWLFVLAWKSDKFKSMGLAVASGLFSAISLATWGGGRYVVFTIALFVLIFTLFTESSKNKVLNYSCWSATYLLSLMFLLADFSISRLKAIENSFVLLVLLFLIIGYFLPKLIPKIYSTKVPKPYISLLITTLALSPIILKFFDLKFILSFISSSSGRTFYTIAENAQPYFASDWWGSFGPIFLFGFLGSVWLFYHYFKPAGKKIALSAASAYVIFFLAFIFGRYSTDSNLSGIVSFFSTTYLYWLAGFLLFIFVLYLLAYIKNPEISHLFKENWHILISVVFFLLTAVLARNSVRLIFATSPAVAIVAGFFVIEAYKAIKQLNTYPIFKYACTIAIIVLFGFTFVTAAQASIQQNNHMGSMVPGQWEASMTFLREKTPQDSVVAHWWDYGHLTATVGERASVTDGGNSMGWNHASGRYFLTGKNDTETLTYFKTHNVTHFLISSEEIPKYPAFSIIGSDENMDRYSSIGVFALQSTKEVRNGTLLLYGGNWGLDQDYIIGHLILPKGQAGIFGFSVASDFGSQTPQAFISYKGQQYTFDVPCLWARGKRYDFKTNESSTFEGCLVLVPYIQDQNNMNAIGAAFWASKKVWDTNFARFYLYNETDPNFKLVYQDDMPLALYRGSIIGPIKIWEVEYPADITSDPFYLQSSTYG
jgi:dolichyl-diphosphooligosaccharide--protein glycosyltransferase